MTNALGKLVNITIKHCQAFLLLLMQVGQALDATSPTVLALLIALIVDFATVLIGIRQNAPIASLDGWV